MLWLGLKQGITGGCPQRSDGGAREAHVREHDAGGASLSGVHFLTPWVQVQQLEGAIRKYYASYAHDGSSGDMLVSGDEPIEKVIRSCGREPVSGGFL